MSKTKSISNQIPPPKHQTISGITVNVSIGSEIVFTVGDDRIISHIDNQVILTVVEGRVKAVQKYLEKYLKPHRARITAYVVGDQPAEVFTPSGK
jgi:hypothetical protein